MIHASLAQLRRALDSRQISSVELSKLFYLFALSWLVAVLLLLAMPTTVPSSIAAGSVVVTIGEWMAPAVLAMMLLLPERKEADDQAEVVDFVYSVIVMLLLAVLVLGSLAIMLLLGHAYIDALLEALLGIGLALLILGWVWNPHLGMAGVGTVFSRYLMSVGMPVEQWLHTLADLAQRRDDPDDFLVFRLGIHDGDVGLLRYPGLAHL